MARCNKCNKFMLFRTQTGYCNACYELTTQKETQVTTKEKSNIKTILGNVNNKEIPALHFDGIYYKVYKDSNGQELFDCLRFYKHESKFVEKVFTELPALSQLNKDVAQPKTYNIKSTDGMFGEKISFISEGINGNKIKYSGLIQKDKLIIDRYDNVGCKKYYNEEYVFINDESLRQTSDCDDCAIDDTSGINIITEENRIEKVEEPNKPDHITLEKSQVSATVPQSTNDQQIGDNSSKSEQQSDKQIYSSTENKEKQMQTSVNNAVDSTKKDIAIDKIETNDVTKNAYSTIFSNTTLLTLLLMRFEELLLEENVIFDAIENIILSFLMEIGFKKNELCNVQSDIIFVPFLKHFISADYPGVITLNCRNILGEIIRKQTERSVKPNNTKSNIAAENDNEETLVETYNCKVVGVTYNNEDGSNRQQIIRELTSKGQLTENTELKLVPQPENPYDSNCIHVRSITGQVLGNLPKELAAIISNGIKHGTCYKAYVNSVLGGGYSYSYGININIKGFRLKNKQIESNSTEMYEHIFSLKAMFLSFYKNLNNVEHRDLTAEEILDSSIRAQADQAIAFKRTGEYVKSFHLYNTLMLRTQVLTEGWMEGVFKTLACAGDFTDAISFGAHLDFNVTQRRYPMFAAHCMKLMQLLDNHETYATELPQYLRSISGNSNYYIDLRKTDLYTNELRYILNGENDN